MKQWIDSPSVWGGGGVSEHGTLPKISERWPRRKNDSCHSNAQQSKPKISFNFAYDKHLLCSCNGLGLFHIAPMDEVKQKFTNVYRSFSLFLSHALPVRRVYFRIIRNFKASGGRVSLNTNKGSNEFRNEPHFLWFHSFFSWMIMGVQCAFRLFSFHFIAVTVYDSPFTPTHIPDYKWGETNLESSIQYCIPACFKETKCKILEPSMRDEGM